MRDEQFLEFLSYIEEKDEKEIAIHLVPIVRRYAKRVFGGEGMKQEDYLTKFFFEVMSITKATWDYNSDESHTNLVKNWKKDDSTTALAIETYYYLHTQKSGKAEATKIDHQMFGGQTFEKKFGLPVPGGYEPEKLVPGIREEENHQSPQPVLSSARKSSDGNHYSRQQIEVLGRETEQATLRRFLNDEPGFRWMQLAGAGGQGKSRMAFDLIEDAPKGWAAGFLRKDDLIRFADHWEDWVPDRPHLMVVDYVIGLEAELTSCLRALTRRASEFRVAVRVLLLERQRWDKSGPTRQEFADSNNDDVTPLYSKNQAAWFSTLNNSLDGDDLSHEYFLFESGVIELTALNSNELVSIVRTSAKQQHGVDLYQDDTFISRALEHIDKSGRPLYAYFLAQALSDETYQLGWQKAELLNSVLKRDQEKRWKRVLGGKAQLPDSRSLATHAAVVATMIRHIDYHQLETLCGWPEISAKHIRQAQVITDTPVDDDFEPTELICGLEPDILGEWFVLFQLDKRAPLASIANAAWTLAPKEMAAFLQRLTHDFPAHPQVSMLLEHQLPNVECEKAYVAIARGIVDDFLRIKRACPSRVARAFIRLVMAGDYNAWLTQQWCRFNVLGAFRGEGPNPAALSIIEAENWWKTKPEYKLYETKVNYAAILEQNKTIFLQALGVFNHDDYYKDAENYDNFHFDKVYFKDHIWEEWPPLALDWRRLEASEVESTLRKLARAVHVQGYRSAFYSKIVNAIQIADIPFYTGFKLVNLLLFCEKTEELQYCLAVLEASGALLPRGLLLTDKSSFEIHVLNELCEELCIDKSAMEYLKFFYSFSHADEDQIHFISDLSKIPIEYGMIPNLVSDIQKHLNDESKIWKTESDNGTVDISTLGLFKNNVHKLIFSVLPSGEVELKQADILFSGVPVVKPKYKRLRLPPSSYHDPSHYAAPAYFYEKPLPNEKNTVELLELFAQKKSVFPKALVHNLGVVSFKITINNQT